MNTDLKQRLQSRAALDANGCLLWAGAKTRNGYGHAGFKGKTVDVHRLAWMADFGNIPEGLCVCHKCDVRNYINPDHLFLGTNVENDADKMAKGRQSKGKAHAKKTRCENHGRAKLSFEKVFEMRWLAAMGRSHQSLADEYGVIQCTASDAISGRTWQFEDHD